jgi:hypothetical protein
MNIEIFGSCLCNKVKFSVHGPFSRFALCHCSRCRKTTGSAYASNIFAEAEQIHWIRGESLIKIYDLPDAKRFRKTFCTNCGAPVPSVSRDGKRLMIPAGCLDSDPDVKPDIQIYCADKVAWYEQAETIKMFDGAPS